MTRCKHNLTPYGCAPCKRLPLDVPEPEEGWSAGHSEPDDRPGWLPAAVIVRALEIKADRFWTPALSAIEALMSDESDSVGGLIGLDLDAYRAARAALIRLGSTQEEA